MLVLEDRIPLLLMTYAPNLWRVFLVYAQDAVGKVQNIKLPFPEYAQVNEKGLLFSMVDRTCMYDIYLNRHAWFTSWRSVSQQIKV